MSEFSSPPRYVLPGELDENATMADFERSFLEAAQEYALILEEARTLTPLERQAITVLDCRRDEVIGRLRSHIKWAQQRGIETTDLERIL